ncbi:hypothetical protein DY000_02052768 [Brassica cretica]|uniref:Uncharacterized protein n=1 Tax=Brassica cretica TaxID=69181 RepID=A0ABQ7A593_BRACR|nr:hypothetical protein DY000_02052768 [Brassica cretica]
MLLLNHVPVKSLIASSPLRHLSCIVAVAFSILCNLSPRLSSCNWFLMSVAYALSEISFPWLILSDVTLGTSSPRSSDLALSIDVEL